MDRAFILAMKRRLLDLPRQLQSDVVGMASGALGGAIFDHQWGEAIDFQDD